MKVSVVHVDSREKRQCCKGAGALRERKFVAGFSVLKLMLSIVL